jgi:hypothetical protein
MEDDHGGWRLIGMESGGNMSKVHSTCEWDCYEISCCWTREIGRKKQSAAMNPGHGTVVCFFKFTVNTRYKQTRMGEAMSTCTALCSHAIPVQDTD